MGLGRKIMGISVGVVLSTLVIRHDYSLYKKVERVEQVIEGTENMFHGGSQSMHVQHDRRIFGLQKEKEDLLSKSYVIKYLY